MHPSIRKLLLVALTVCLLPLAGAPAHAADRTSAQERARVDAVPTPALRWEPCEQGECARVRLPLDYDRPNGETVEVALSRLPARDQARRIGSLFLNPGGPGASGKDFPQRAAAWLGPDVLDRFDLIGMDPRGTNDSTNSRCFRSTKRLDRVTGTLIGTLFPVTKAEERRFTQAAATLSQACSRPGRKLEKAMSTAQVARDMDVLRRAVGDDKLSFLGFSYGTYLGQVYANLFPDRVRAIVIDGVVDPRAWVGKPATAATPVSVRMDSAAASSAALDELLRRCAANADCPLASPKADFARVANGLRAKPVVLEDPDNGPLTITYQMFITTVLYALYSEEGAESIPYLTATLQQLQVPNLALALNRTLSGAYRRTAARATERVGDYFNEVEQVPIVLCSDSRNPRSLATWSRLADAEDARASWFGRHWLWGSVYCAGEVWTAYDEDAYRGRFDAVTANPVLVVGNYHDPATNYAAAKAVAGLIPRSRLLSSNNWGHTAYGVSACATGHVDRYLISGTLPRAGTVCSDGKQPFSG
ncbi:MAG: alpha/beta hydrolase [Micropruina sp.]|uniref:alpha/beta hydrolase n=1 Tax=Micropruina sp. TaxID=2737536 RepID=UPI0039E70A71